MQDEIKPNFFLLFKWKERKHGETARHRAIEIKTEIETKILSKPIRKKDMHAYSNYNQYYK